ncbi:MAG: DNA glycosylase AlkZ-like family protein, partial [Candidatus Binatia bacterium]
MKLETTREAVAALFLERQRLDRPRARNLSAASLVDFARATGGIQLDSINVLERAHLLTLWSRFGEFDRRRFETLAYGRRLLFEYWAHAACLIAADDLPAWRRVMLDYRVRHRGWPSFLRRNPRLLAEVESAIRDRGPLGNADFDGPRPRGASPGWWSWKPATHALDYLWMSGRLLVSSRVHFQKRYDLAERVLGDVLAVEPPTAEAFRRWHVRRALSAMGAATETDLRMYLTFPRTTALERRRTLAAMLAEGEVVEISVRGDSARWLILREDVRALARVARRPRPSIGTTFLSPFDSFLWH